MKEQEHFAWSLNNVAVCVCVCVVRLVLLKIFCHTDWQFLSTSWVLEFLPTSAKWTEDISSCPWSSTRSSVSVHCQLQNNAGQFLGPAKKSSVLVRGRRPLVEIGSENYWLTSKSMDNDLCI